MLRSIMVGLDGSSTSEGAVELGLRWAGQFNALLVGIGIVDEPTICNQESIPPGAGPYKIRRDKVLLRKASREVEQLLEKFALRCTEAGVACKLLEEVGEPSEQILLEAQRFDVVLLGRESHFHFQTQDRADETLRRVIKHGPRPVVAVPESLPAGKSTLVAYDGSLQAARALFAFWATGLAQAMPVHVVSVASTKVEAAVHADRAVEFLRSHGIAAESHADESDHDPARVLLEYAARLEAGLVVAGAFGQPVLRDFFLGSVTKSLLRDGKFPLFLSH